LDYRSETARVGTANFGGVFVHRVFLTRLTAA
jgi:hypothetical protein